MYLFAMIALVMINFAANSVLSRAGINVFGMDPLVFSGVRLAAGAAMLAAIVSLRRSSRDPLHKGATVKGGWPPIDRARFISAGWLLIYLVPFSLAYLTLPSGVGALILFGVVQITMFAGSALSGLRPTVRQWLGMGIAMAGLAWLLWPGGGVRLDGVGVAFMALAGLGWGVFSLRGRGAKTPLADMAVSFCLLLPAAGLLVLVGGALGAGSSGGWSLDGFAIAVICGAVTSGLGYALWYRVLPQIAATTGAVAQLSVPVIAMGAGAVALGEIITIDVVLASAVVLGGIAVSVLKR